MKRPLAAVTAALLAAAAGPAKPNLAGAWAFKTEPYHDGQCTLEGSLNLRPGAKQGEFDCLLVAYETCPSYKVRAEQSCQAKQTPDGLAISSTVTRVTPKDADNSYMPDNFELTRVSTERMEGSLQSAAVAPVVFVRPEPAVS